MSGIARINKLPAVPRDGRAAAMSIASAPVSCGIKGPVAPPSAYPYSRALDAPKCPVHVMSRIGAGDGFGAGFLHGLIRGLSWTSACGTATLWPRLSLGESVVQMQCHT